MGEFAIKQSIIEWERSHDWLQTCRWM